MKFRITLLLLSDGILAAASTCTTSQSLCAADGSGSYIDVSNLAYNDATGIFTGKMVTNGCPNFPYGNYTSSAGFYAGAGGTSPTCTTVTFPITTATPTAASLRGNVGYTISGTNIYGCMDNGFTAGQACSTQQGTCDAGTDVGVCVKQMQLQCGTSFTTTMGLDVCGGHASPYHHHFDLVCQYNKNATGHSALIGIANDGRGIYGRKESSYSLPTDLDYCGGHYGPVPAGSINGVSFPAASNVYHYHTQDDAPYTIGCFGPVTTLSGCKSLYNTCGTGYSSMIGSFANGTQCSYSYDTDCPCFGKGGVFDNNQMCAVAKTVTPTVTFNAYTSTNWATLLANPTMAGGNGGPPGGGPSGGKPSGTSSATAATNNNPKSSTRKPNLSPSWMHVFIILVTAVFI